MILPLANRRDKYTQVLWGIRDFEFRFGRKPEGMWLSETAADSETLDVLANFGIASQFSRRFRRKACASWPQSIGKMSTAVALIPLALISANFLPGGKSACSSTMPVSQAIAFEHLLESGEQFAGRLMSAFSDSADWDQLVHVATDGESYGHHHRYGEMALAYALQHIESNTSRGSRTTPNTWSSIRPPTRRKFTKAARGVARTASAVDGELRVQQRRHAGWHQDGARRSGRHSIGCAINSRRSTSRRRGAFQESVGRTEPLH
jgi:hypothetical protein